MQALRVYIISTILFLVVPLAVRAQIDSLSGNSRNTSDHTDASNTGILRQAQSRLDSLDSVIIPINTIGDSTKALKTLTLQRIDSGKNIPLLTEVRDSASWYQQQMDSVKRWMSEEVSGLQKEYTDRTNKISEVQQKLQSKMDSLGRAGLSDNKLAASLDSINQQPNKLQQEFQSKLSHTKNQAIEKLDAIEVPPEMQQHMRKLKSTIAQIGPSQIAGSFDVPGIEYLRNGLPSIPDLKSNTDLINGIKIPDGAVLPGGLTLPRGMPNADLPISSTDLAIRTSDQIAKLPKVSDVTSQSGKVMSEINTVKEQPIDNLAESQVTSINGVKEIQRSAKLEGVDALQSQEALKAEMNRQAQAVAIDHFSDKQAQLKAAMEKMSKYKQKYGEVKSIADIEKKPRNPLRERAFHERLLPGLGLQILKKGDNILADFNPYVGYKFTPRINAGAGWNQRVGYNWEIKSFGHNSQVYGPRVYGEFNLSKGFSPRLEIELMHALVPPATIRLGDPSSSHWVPGAFAGIKKQYKIYKQLRGTASVMFRLLDLKRQSPYGDVVNARVGFEYVVKKAKKSSK